MVEQVLGRLLVLGAAAFVAFILSRKLIGWLQPWLARHATVRPNTRSLHHAPTPQGGGIGVVLATLAVAWGAIALLPALPQSQSNQFLTVSAATILLAVVGVIDDMRSMPATARLVAQCIAVGAVLVALPNEMRLVPQAPWWVDRACLFLGGVWFVNLVNFMDGIDWMNVAELVPVTGAFIIIGLFDTIGPLPAVIAAALFGAIIGFAPFNKPVAQLFLGDAGSLPVGLLLAWLLLQLAGNGHLAAALILPLYYLADATITLALRIARREQFWLAHRTHFYQRATDKGFTVPAIVAWVFLVNLVLAALALVTVAAGGTAVSLLALASGGAIVAWLLLAFAHGR
jgi:UDP-N-acetylmuramyl pentapeptide phosphotransferase/UDP-N-acetylglucosamine-1-phosphate transferase